MADRKPKRLDSEASHVSGLDSATRFKLNRSILLYSVLDISDKTTYSVNLHYTSFT